MCFLHQDKTKWTHLITFSSSKILQNYLAWYIVLPVWCYQCSVPLLRHNELQSSALTRRTARQSKTKAHSAARHCNHCDATMADCGHAQREILHVTTWPYSTFALGKKYYKVTWTSIVENRAFSLIQSDVRILRVRYINILAKNALKSKLTTGKKFCDTAWYHTCT